VVTKGSLFDPTMGQSMLAAAPAVVDALAVAEQNESPHGDEVLTQACPEGETMHPQAYQQLVDLYRYSPEDQACFQEIAAYSQALEQWLRDHQFHPAQLFRYMLAGFFTDYQACLHLGRPFTTIPYPQLRAGRQRTQYETFNHYTGAPIRTTDAYLVLMKCPGGRDLPKLYQGSLVSFVIDGHL
jgi:hypothetical protein